MDSGRDFSIPCASNLGREWYDESRVIFLHSLFAPLECEVHACSWEDIESYLQEGIQTRISFSDRFFPARAKKNRTLVGEKSIP